MKKILVGFLVIFIFFTFVACNTGNGPNVEFIKLYGPSYKIGDVFEYYEVDSKAKILTYYLRDLSEGDGFSPMYDYSYTYNETEKTFSIKYVYLINEEGKRISIEDEEKVKEFLSEKYKTFPDSDNISEEEYIESWIESFKISNHYKILNLEENLESRAYIIEAIGMYDDSKEWNDQLFGSFAGGANEDYITISKILSSAKIDDVEYEITSISENKITCVNSTNNEEKLELSYTKTGSKEEAVITVIYNDNNIELKWFADPFML